MPTVSIRLPLPLEIPTHFDSEAQRVRSTCNLLSFDRLDDFHAVCVDFFTGREAFTIEAMRNIDCPVYMVHCGADVAYDIATTNQVADHLRTAGVSVHVVQIPDAPHLGIITHPKEVNALFHEFLLSVCAIAPSIPDHVESPWKAQLIAHLVERPGEFEVAVRNLGVIRASRVGMWRSGCVRMITGQVVKQLYFSYSLKRN
ncbi:hypothetical protein DFH06DRAFT_1332138 [Mycena polygramma]|nr:hypothetical protein DFH06DRAFT_1332138 [Mycena polygramma]